MTEEFDWKKPFGLYTRGHVKLEFYSYVAGSGMNIQTMWAGDGSMSLAEIRNKFLESKVNIIVENKIIFETTLADLVLSKLRDDVAVLIDAGAFKKPPQKPAEGAGDGQANTNEE